MKPHTCKELEAYFRKIHTAILWPSDISNLLSQHRHAWNAYDVNVGEVVEFLQESSFIRIAEFLSPRYRKIVRYIRGNPSPHRIALSLRRNSFLCHGTALELHNFAPNSKVIYVNQEQHEKPPGQDLTQAALTLAFKNQQRQSKFRFVYEGHEYVLLTGKNTGRAGIVKIQTDAGEELYVTDLERTFIDIVVRPAYAGGIQKVAAVYKAAAAKLKVDHMIRLLDKLDYLYPYAQSLGFLLERSGYHERDLKKLERRRSEFDFFLDYGHKDRVYNERWQLHYPVVLD